MAHLLGSEICIESLIKDITDIQNTVSEISSKTGKVNFCSWKYPNQYSIDIDATSIIEMCQFDDESNESNQVSHVQLYDLLIDRLQLLIQLFFTYNEMLLSEEDCIKKGSTSTTNSMSIGLSCKRCWSRVSQVSLNLQQMSIMYEKTRDENENLKMFQIEQCKPNSNNKSENYFHEEEENLGSQDISIQTLETSYEDCQFCTSNQSCLYQVSKSIVLLCKSLNLPTSLENYTDRIAGETMSNSEVTRWKNLQVKDLSRLERHIKKLMNELNPLKNELKKLKNKLNESEKLKVQLTEKHKSEISHQARDLLQEKSLLKKEVESLQFDYEVALKNEEKVKNLMTNLENEITILKEEIILLKRKNFKLEGGNEELVMSKNLNVKHKQDIHNKSEEIENLKNQLKKVNTESVSTLDMLKVEKLKSQKFQKLYQLTQDKQNVLLEKFKNSNEEIQQLENQVEKFQDKNYELEKRIETITNEHEEKLSNIKKELSTHRNIVHNSDKTSDLQRQLEESLERERMMACFPDMTSKVPPPQETGDIVTDMKSQIKSNEFRISNIRLQNENLLSILSKIEAKQKHKEDTFDLNAESPINDMDNSFDDASLSSFRSVVTNDGNNTSQLIVTPTPSVMTSARRRGRGSEVLMDDKLTKQLASSNRKSFTIGSGKRRPPSSTPSVTSQSDRKPWM